MPNLVDAQIELADAYVKDGQIARAGRIIKDVWVNNFLDAATEKDLYQRYRGQLTNAEHWARANRLLMHDRARAVERIFGEFSPAQQSLLKAVIAVARKDNKSQTLLDRVDPQYRNHNLFHWANAEWAQLRGSDAGAVAHLNRAAGELPESHLWWYKRRYLARELLESGDKKNAYLAAAGYTNGPEGRVVDAQFHAGWIALRFLGDAATASKHFEKMASLSTLPSSISESNYWWGRAFEAMGQIENARVKYQRAAKHDDYYYGQLASHKLNVQQLRLSPLPAWQDAEAGFNRRELVQAIRLFEGNKTYGLARPLIRRLIYQVKAPGEMLLTARLAQDIEAHDLAILMASISSNRGVDLDLFEFPKDGLPKNQLASIDAAAVYAVARQESRFDRTAQSHSGALGLMQLMPGTAKETAGKLGLSYSKSRLTSDPSYNALLGSTYLKAQLERYDGSLVLAAAAYNAGAGNVNKWLKRFGDPRSGKIDVVDWIELIPFTETRGYVQKVLANYQVYRVRLGDSRLRLANYLMKID
jgi:soluble lytic murein transglycosylase